MVDKLRKMSLILLLLGFNVAFVFRPLPVKAVSIPALPIGAVPIEVLGPYAAAAASGLGVAHDLGHPVETWNKQLTAWDMAYAAGKSVIDPQIQAAKDRGDKVMSVTSDVVDWLKTNFGKLFRTGANVPSSADGISNFSITDYGQPPKLRVGANFSGSVTQIISPTNIVTVKDGSIESFFWGGYVSDNYMTFHDGTDYNKVIGFSGTSANSTEIASWREMFRSAYLGTGNVPTLTLFVGFMIAGGANVYLGAPPADVPSDRLTSYDNPDYVAPLLDVLNNPSKGGEKTLALPDVYAYPADASGNRTSDAPLTAKPKVGSPTEYDLTNSDGSVYNGPVEYVPGELVTPADGSDAYIQNPAAGDTADSLTGTRADPITGETANTGEGTGENTGDTTNGDPTGVNWDKLKGIGTAFTRQFPFSLPWDIANGFNAIFGVDTGDDPKWHLDFGSGFKFDLELPQSAKDFMPYWRGFVVLSFDIAMIYAVRKLLGGAQ